MSHYREKPKNKRFRDVEGLKFGRLLVCGYLGSTREDGHQLWDCKCDCGKFVILRSNTLLTNLVKSCGCLRSETTARLRTTHGQSRTATYASYHHAKNRCCNEQDPRYSAYGGRGIKMCERWILKGGFAKFRSDMGDKPSGYTLERKDVNGGYCPENCVWIPRKDQSLNKRNTVRISALGKTMLICEWSLASGLSERTIRSRLQRGWSRESSVTLPLQKSGTMSIGLRDLCQVCRTPKQQT